jgi:hypothetical protein
MSSSLFPLNIGPHTTSSQPPRVGCVLITGGRLTPGADGLPMARADMPGVRHAYESVTNHPQMPGNPLNHAASAPDVSRVRHGLKAVCAARRST